MRAIMIAVLVTASLAQTVAAKPALRDVKLIDDGLFTVGLADQIRKKCPTISGRLFKGLTELRSLQSEAYARGYTKAEIEAHVDSDVEKDRLRARAAKYMAERGFKQNEAGYCALGHEEIKRGSEIGALLRSSD